MVGGRAPDEIVRQRVVKLGPCSAVLLSGRLAVTSAHCLAFPIHKVQANGEVIPVTSCEPHPAYVEGVVTHDIATCILERVLTIGETSLESSPLVPGTRVTIAGYGRTNAFNIDAGTLQQVDTSVAGSRDEAYLVGTPDRTACSGDSGGPVFVRHGTELRLAAIVHGTTGAVCASSADAVSVALHHAWLEEARRQSSESSAAPYSAGVLVAVASIVVVRHLAKRIRA